MLIKISESACNIECITSTNPSKWGGCQMFCTQLHSWCNPPLPTVTRVGNPVTSDSPRVFTKYFPIACKYGWSSQFPISRLLLYVRLFDIFYYFWLDIHSFIYVSESVIAQSPAGLMAALYRVLMIDGCGFWSEVSWTCLTSFPYTLASILNIKIKLIPTIMKYRNKSLLVQKVNYLCNLSLI